VNEAFKKFRHITIYKKKAQLTGLLRKKTLIPPKNGDWLMRGFMTTLTVPWS